MKTSKFFLAVAIFFATLFTATAGIPETPVTIESTLHNELLRRMQTRDLWEHHVNNEEMAIQFRINEAGEIDLMAINTDNEYLKRLAIKKLHHQKVELPYIPQNTTFKVRIRFELK